MPQVARREHDRHDAGLTTLAARAILGPAATTDRRGDQVAAQLEHAIRIGLLRGGARLPSEAQLADQMRVATMTLREALATLRERGLVTTRRGRGGGTFVVATDTHSEADVSARLQRWSLQQIRELGDHRLAIVGTAAYLAAKRALPYELSSLRAAVRRLARATTSTERGRADGQFVLEVAAASQSTRLTGAELRLRAELGDVLWWRLATADRTQWVRIREDLVENVHRRDARSAREAAELQVATDTRRLMTLRLGLRG